MKAEFLLTDAQVGLLGLVYGVLYSVCAAPLAALANRTSRRAVIVACMMCFSLFTAFCGIAWNYATLLISRTEEHTSELQSLMRISYAVFCLKKKIHKNIQQEEYTKLN